jgi:protein TonB
VIGGGRLREERRGRRVAVLVSLVLHGGLWLVAWRSFSARIAVSKAPAPVEVSFEAAPSPEAPPSLQPPSEQPRARGGARQPQHQPRAPSLRAESAGASPGERANVPDPGSNLPVDLTGETLLAVSSSPGGEGSASSGKGGSTTAQLGGGVSAPTSGGADGTSDQSGGVSLPNQNWSCPWPREADEQKIDEETVTIRVVVDMTGAVESVIVLSDPGHGFGQNARACALRTRFTPARDREGRPMRATSPPILVRFTR